MEKAKRTERLWLIVTVSTALTGVIGIPFLALFALKGYYVIMSVFILVVAHGFYATPFYYLAYSRAKALRLCICALSEHNKLTYSEISGITHLTETAVRARLNDASRKDYIKLLLDEDGAILEQ